MRFRVIVQTPEDYQAYLQTLAGGGTSATTAPQAAGSGS
jgi:heme/copper-type cytochrome/quinol oxidase subunit 2